MPSYRPIPDQCLDELEAVEEWRPQRYLDGSGYPTIAYGHRIFPTSPEAHVQTCTKEQGLAWLREDLGVAATAVTRAILPFNERVNDNQYSALVSFTFNAGVSAFQNSTLLKLLRAGDMAGAAAQFLRWDKEKDPHTGALVDSPGLLNRRKVEMALFQKAMTPCPAST